VDGEIFTIPKITIEETYINDEGKEIKLYDLRQIPVRLAYALSYSSVQGMTVTGDVVIYGFCKVKAANGEAQKVPTQIFQNNALYVALSRVKTSQNLYFFTGAPNEHKLYYDLLIGSYRTNYETVKWLQSA
jgi:hypothetical protein